MFASITRRRDKVSDRDRLIDLLTSFGIEPGYVNEPEALVGPACCVVSVDADTPKVDGEFGTHCDFQFDVTGKFIDAWVIA